MASSLYRPKSPSSHAASQLELALSDCRSLRSFDGTRRAVARGRKRALCHGAAESEKSWPEHQETTLSAMKKRQHQKAVDLRHDKRTFALRIHQKRSRRFLCILHTSRNGQETVRSAEKKVRSAEKKGPRCDSGYSPRSFSCWYLLFVRFDMFSVFWRKPENQKPT